MIHFLNKGPQVAKIRLFFPLQKDIQKHIAFVFIFVNVFINITFSLGQRSLQTGFFCSQVIKKLEK